MFLRFPVASEVVVDHTGVKVVQSLKTRLFFQNLKRFQSLVRLVFSRIRPSYQQLLCELFLNRIVQALQVFLDFGVTALLHVLNRQNDVNEIVVVAVF